MGMTRSPRLCKRHTNVFEWHGTIRGGDLGCDDIILLIETGKGIIGSGTQGARKA